MTTLHLVVGAGEVGTAVFEVLDTWAPDEVVLRDIDPIRIQADVLHVCFPWSDDFVGQVRGYELEHGVEQVIVHSTVPVGTCDAHGWVHSPVRGRHPHLTEGLETFVKHFGGVGAAEAAELWPGPTRVHARARDTEAGKLWELIQYGVQIRVEKAIHAWCLEHNVDPGIAYRQFAQTYNEGYTRLGDDHFVRPVLKHMPGPIGGHCVVQNAPLIDHPLARIVTDGFA